MLRVLLQTRRRSEYLVVGKAWRGHHFCQRRLAIGERSGLVQDERAAARYLFQHRGILDDDPTLRRLGDRPNDADRNGDQQRAGGCNYQHCQESLRVAACQPRQGRHRDRQRRVPCAEPVGDAPDPRAAAFGGGHHLHDSGVARIDGQLFGGDRHHALLIDGAGEHAGPGRLGDFIRLAGQVGLVHRAMAFDDNTVHGTDLVRENHDNVADGNVSERDVHQAGLRFAMRGLRRPLSQRVEHGGRAVRSILFQGGAAGEHQHDDRADQVLSDQQGSENGNARQQIRPELPRRHVAQQAYY